ncbi:hypothetical protein [Novacetimonas pomaceti]|uniref:hypothetical protein n=1 Tax=Novacetimonas pomaceti TaxID=2021998 RepID=UPI001C2D3922|nr:hypothetical protein [Novacetimonas pomaceti]MBV1833041.1 hypothetical protein [Novacetimonas pomaceti]
MSYVLRITGDLTETIELVSQNRCHVFLRRNGEIVMARAEAWQRLVQSGRVREVGNG